MSADIVVVGGSGTFGRFLLAELRRRGADVVATSHSAAGRDRLQALTVGVVDADLRDPVSLRAAFDGARAVYVIPPVLHQREDELAIEAVQAATAAGVRRFVLHSVLHPNTPDLRNHLRKAHAEVALRDSELDWTILQPSMFAQVILAVLDQPGPQVRVPFDPEQPLAVVDLADLAEAAARVLLEDGHTYATYEACGPLTTLAAMVAVIAEARGVRLRPLQIPVADAPLPPAARADSMSTADMISTFAHYDRHGFRGNPAVLELLLGRRPRTFAEVVEDRFAARPPTP